MNRKTTGNAGGPPPDLLFVGHDATRTGAPLMLLYFMRWLRDNTDLTFQLVVVDGGPLVDDFAALAPVTVLADLGRGWVSRALERIGLGRFAPVGRRSRERAAVRSLRHAPVVYCNSISSVSVLPLLGPPDPSRVVITHVHEMEGAFRSTSREVLEILFSATDRFVAASERVRRLLMDTYDVEPELVVRHYEFIDVEAMAGTPPEDGEVLAARERCGIPATAGVVGAVGVTQWRKGPDLFLLLAQVLRSRPDGREVHFVWVGADPDADETVALRKDIERAGLGDRVHLLGPDPSPARWFRLFDVYVLTSREDPFPLVCLESSLLGTPIVCFDNTGMAEFAGDGDCGYMVDYLDVEAMADRVTMLLDDPELRRVVGERAATRVRAEFDVSVGAPSLYRDIEAWWPRP